MTNVIPIFSVKKSEGVQAVLDSISADNPTILVCTYLNSKGEWIYNQSAYKSVVEILGALEMLKLRVVDAALND